MSVISKKSILGTASTALLLFLVAILSQVLYHPVVGVIIISEKEEKCLEKTGKLFEAADEDLLTARQEFTAAMQMDMTSKDKMYAKYPEDKVKNYDTYCSKNGGRLHVIKMDFFDCLLLGTKDDIELTLKNFANCMADVDECKGFGQEHLLQEAWKELGLNCVLEEEETKKDPPKGNDNDVNDDIAKKEEEAAAKGADDYEKEEKKSEYVSKEELGKNGKKKKKGGFMNFVLFLSVCGAGYFVFDRKRRGLPIELPPALASRLNLSGPSRFARRPQSGFVSDYNLLSAEDNTLQLSSNLA